MRNFKTICIATFWNPFLIIFISLIRGFSLPLDPATYFRLLLTLIAGLFLYFAVLKIYDSGRKTVAKVLFAILAPAIFFQLLPALPAGWFLYFAVLRIHNSGRKRTAKVLFVILAPITSFLSIIGGLFGPIGIVLYSLVASIPAWTYWLVCKLMDAKKGKENGEQS